MADGMAGLCRAADVVVPNLTEASHLLGVPYRRVHIPQDMWRMC